MCWSFVCMLDNLSLFFMFIVLDAFNFSFRKNFKLLALNNTQQKMKRKLFATYYNNIQRDIISQKWKPSEYEVWDANKNNKRLVIFKTKKNWQDMTSEYKAYYKAFHFENDHRPLPLKPTFSNWISVRRLHAASIV